jgi:hypothetical protein
MPKSTEEHAETMALLTKMQPCSPYGKFRKGRSKSNNILGRKCGFSV